MAEWNRWPGLITVRMLAEGTYSRIYEVKKEGNTNGKSYALKVISVPGDRFSGGQNMSPENRMNFYQGIADDIYNEISAVGELSVQRGLVTYYECNIIEYRDRQAFDIVTRMELLTPLLRYLETHVLSGEDIFRLYYEINDALSRCHSAGIIHGDISLDSIYADEKDNSFKLGGFGLRRLTDASCSAEADKDALNALLNDLRSLNAKNTDTRRRRQHASRGNAEKKQTGETGAEIKSGKVRKPSGSGTEGPYQAQAAGQGKPEDDLFSEYENQNGDFTAGYPWDTAADEKKKEDFSSDGYPEGETAWRRSGPAASPKKKSSSGNKKKRILAAGLAIAGTTAGILIAANALRYTDSGSSYQEHVHYEHEEADPDIEVNDSIPTAEEAEDILRDHMDYADHTEENRNLFGTVTSRCGYDSDDNMIYSVYYEGKNIPESVTIYEADGSWDYLYTGYYNDGDLRWFSEYEDGYTYRMTTFASDGGLDYAVEYVRDDDGNTLMEQNYDSDGTLDYVTTYEREDGRVKSMNVTNYRKGEVDYIYTYEYDDNGNMLRQDHYDADGEIIGWSEYEYEKFNRYYYEVKSTFYNKDGSVDYYVEYERDSDGDLTRSVYYDADGNVTGEYDY